jgi:hypothetical protein
LADGLSDFAGDGVAIDAGLDFRGLSDELSRRLDA